MNLETSRRRRGRHDQIPTNSRREATDFSRWIEKKGLPVREVARLVGVTPRSVYLWAAGLRVPDLVAAARVSEVTEGEVEWTSFLNTKLARAIYADLVAHSGEGGR